MAALHSFLFKLASSSSSNLPFPKQHKKNQSQMLSLCLFVFLTTFSLLVLSFSIHRRLNNRKKKVRETEQETLKPTRLTHDPSCPDPARETDRVDGNGSAHQLPRSARSLLLEILPSDSPKWERLFGAENEAGPDASEPGRVDPGVDQRAGKRKKKRARKKSSNSKGEEEDNSGNNNGEEGFVRSREKPDLVCLYPFTSSSSVTQRKIKQQYDELMKCHHSRRLTLAQVGQFANCLVEAKNELQHKADVIQRKFTITKALLVKADRSSFDRLRQQIYKLELEQKRLEEDAFVYNWLQQQLKLSPAYKRMLEIGARMELKAKSGELLESRDPEYSDISFEELLAQEKKDSFWQRNGKLRPCSR